MRVLKWLFVSSMIAASCAGVGPSVAAGIDQSNGLLKQQSAFSEGFTRQEMLLTNPAYMSLLPPSCASESLGLTLAVVAEGCAYDPFRSPEKWNGTRGRTVPVSFQDRHGVTLRGDLWGPSLPFKDPDTGRLSSGPFPAVIVVEGSEGGARGFEWAAEGLAENGYIVMTFDVEGQLGGHSEGSQDMSEFNPVNFATSYGKQIVLDDSSDMRQGYESIQAPYLVSVGTNEPFVRQTSTTL